MEYVVSVMALLVAVCAVLYAREVERTTFSVISDQREYAKTLWTVHEKDIAELREAQATLQAMLQEDVDPPPWPPVHRTTSTCYVRLEDAPLSIWRAWERGRFPIWAPAELENARQSADRAPIDGTGGSGRVKDEIRNVHPHHDNFAGDPTPDRSGP